MSRKPIFTSSSILLCSILSATAWADGHSPTEAKQPLKLQDVTVTGTKEGEVKLQEVPAAISAYTEEDMSDAGIGNIKDLRMQTPGLNITSNGESTRLYMRGVGSNLDFIGADPSVTVHVDGVYQSRTTSILDDFLDVERVEVLRGPQGTLYGRNSTGGTINIVTKVPQKEREAKIFAELGSYNYLSYGGSLGGAISGDDVLGRISVVKTDHDPYVKNENPNGIDGLLDDDSLNSRGALRFLLDKQSELIVRANYSDVDRNPGAYKTTLMNTDGSEASRASDITLLSDPWSMNVNDIDPYTEKTAWGTSIEYSRVLSPELTLVSLTGYNDNEIDLREDTDGSDSNFMFTELHDKQNQISEELRLAFQTDNLKGTAGVFYLSEEQETDTVVNVDVLVTDSPLPATVLEAKNEVTAYAIFGQGTYAISNRLNGTFGLRYSKEEKEFNNTKNGNAGPFGYLVDEKADWDAWSPKLGVDYTYESGTMVYASASRGFKSGGFNMTAEDAEFSPEKVWSYELGAKMEHLDNKLRSNLTFFYYDYEDLQVQTFSEPGQIFIENAADATIYGFEIENHWTPTYDLLLELDYAFLNAEYDSYESSLGDSGGDDMIAAPKHKLNAAAQMFHDTQNGTLSYRLEYLWQDEQFFTAPNQEVSSQKAYGLLNARVSYQTADEKCEIQLFGENLTNKAYSTSTREFPGNPLTSATIGNTGVTKDINPPRTFGVRYIHNF